MSSQADYKDREFLAVIGDEASHSPSQGTSRAPTQLLRDVSRIRRHRHADAVPLAQDSVTGLLLAGIGVGSTPMINQRLPSRRFV